MRGEPHEEPSRAQSDTNIDSLDRPYFIKLLVFAPMLRVIFWPNYVYCSYLVDCLHPLDASAKHCE